MSYVLHGIREQAQPVSGRVLLDGTRAFSWVLSLTGNTILEIENVQVGAAYTFELIQPPGGGCDCVFAGPSFDVYARSLVTIATGPGERTVVIGVGSQPGTVTIAPNAPADPILAAPTAVSAAYDSGAPSVTVTFDKEVLGPDAPGYPLGTLLTGTASLITASSSDGSPDIVYSLDVPLVPGETVTVDYSAGNGVANLDGVALVVPASVPVPNPAPLYPDTLPNKALWFFADDVTPDPPPIAPEGLPYMSSWADHFFGYTVAPPSPPNGQIRPRFRQVDALLNGASSVKFFTDSPIRLSSLQNTSDEVSNFPTGNGDFTLYFVGYGRNAIAFTLGLVGYLDPRSRRSISYQGDYLGPLNGRLYVWSGDGSFFGLQPEDQPFIFSISYSGSCSASQAFINGVLCTTGSANTNSLNIGTRNLVLGANSADLPFSQFNDFWLGSIASLLIYSEAHDTPTREAVETWLANYYGITLP